MDDQTIKVLKERFEALPKSIQDMIMSTNYEETLLKIGQNNKLNVAQLAVLEKETTMVMMGLTDPEDFEEDLTRELGVSKELGFVIVAEINEEIFKDIRSLLKIMTTGEDAQPAVEKKEVVINKDEEVLKSAGIEITSNQENKQIPTASSPVIEKPKNTMPSIMAQKLGGSFKLPATDTKHEETNTPKVNPIGTVAKNTIPKVDPYREVPE
ncbi:MAG: hypothetical protein KBD52_00740 [Candidatus Pacebacteria bacterium]|nr:hypothetical protein [Candidatus Paceibacterota bacterium]